MEMGHAAEIPANVPARRRAPKPWEQLGECKGMKWKDCNGMEERMEWNGVEENGNGSGS